MINNQTQSHRHIINRFKYPGDASGFITDDFTWTDQEIIIELLSIRSSIIQSYIKAGMDLSEQMWQILDCVLVKEADRNECPCAAPAGCYWLKSIKPLPKFIKIISVTGTTVHGDMEVFTHKRWDQLKRVPESRIRAEREGLYWTTRDTGKGAYLYLYGDTFLEQVSLSLLAENPMEAAAYPSCGTPDQQKVCNPLDTDFYTDSELTNKILSVAWSSLLPVRQSAPTDVKNNDNSRI